MARCAALRMWLPSTAGMAASTSRSMTRSVPSAELAHSLSAWCSPFPSTLANTNGGYPSSSLVFSTFARPALSGSLASPGSPCRKYTTPMVAESGPGGRHTQTGWVRLSDGPRTCSTLTVPRSPAVSVVSELASLVTPEGSTISAQNTPRTPSVSSEGISRRRRPPPSGTSPAPPPPSGQIPPGPPAPPWRLK